MRIDTTENPTSVVGPDGARITRKDLPSPTTRRWVARRKAAVVAAVKGGLISVEEADVRGLHALLLACSWERGP